MLRNMLSIKKCLLLPNRKRACLLVPVIDEVEPVILFIVSIDLLMELFPDYH